MLHDGPLSAPIEWRNEEANPSPALTRRSHPRDRLGRVRTERRGVVVSFEIQGLHEEPPADATAPEAKG
jgi:hypothetical protein